ncbi:tape measure protein [Thauera sp. 2A1]|uniref:tape measure protein n=1 Tax=Thauera sp. 2A1 TaxID=2570191 RepID=UPI0012920C5B|nr:tape measure protein [Thauera sp. 2A1]KAI5914626.1 tape measure protein [Thauera sp. 2A1]
MALGDQSLNFRITADGAQAVGMLRKFGQEVGGLRQQADSVTQSFRPLQGVLSAIGASLGAAQIIQTADAYGTMTARLRLATQYTANFTEVQAALKQAATETRAPLQETVELYTRLAPALNGIGRSGAASVGVITTINQAIALSGATAGEAQASLMQFGQGMASGALRGDELNSVLEQTPALADAIAEGLGVTRGELRKLGEQGALTTEVVVKALEKVSARVAGDFRSLPMTVGQAVTLLQNQVSEIVGTADQGSGALQAIARAIVFVADGIKDFSNAGETIRPFVEFISDAIDGVARLFRIVGTGLAGYSLAIKQALSGDLEGALATYREIGVQVEKILLEPMAAQKRTVAEAESTAKARGKIESDLATEIGRLESLRAVMAGKANADILLDDKALQSKRIEEARKATEEQLKGTERLRDALRTAWDGAIEGARRAKEEAAALMQQAADARQSGQDKAADRLMKGMTPEERDAEARRQARDLTDQASGSAARATIKAFEGDLKGAEKLAAEAAKQAERAERFAEQITDDRAAANLFEELGKIRSEALKAQAKIKQQEAQQQEETATAIQGQIQAAEQRLVVLKAELAKPVGIQLDITAAEAKIKTLIGQLAELNAKAGGGAAPAQGDVRRIENAMQGGAQPSVPAITPEKKVEVSADTAKAETALEGVKTAVDAIPAEKTVMVRTVGDAGTSSFSDAASAWNSKQNGFATGGHVRGPGSGTSDSILARLSNGEFVVRAAAVRHYGASFLAALNSMAVPRFASGGLVSSALQPALADSGGGNTPVVLDMGQLGRFETTAREDVADEIVRMFRRAALSRGRR